MSIPIWPEYAANKVYGRRRGFIGLAAGAWYDGDSTDWLSRFLERRAP